MTARRQASVWGAEVRAGSYGGHDGLVYTGGPSTFDDLVAGTAKWTDRTFLVHGDRRIRFAEFRTAAHAARAHLAGLGIGPGDRVMVSGYNSPEWVVALWALWLSAPSPCWPTDGGAAPKSTMPSGSGAPHVLSDSDLGVTTPHARSVTCVPRSTPMTSTTPPPPTRTPTILR